MTEHYRVRYNDGEPTSETHQGSRLGRIKSPNVRLQSTSQSSRIESLANRGRPCTVVRESSRLTFDRPGHLRGTGMHGRRMAALGYNSFSLAVTDRIAGPIAEPPERPSLCATCGVTRLARHVATKPAVSYFLSAPTVMGTVASCAWDPMKNSVVSKFDDARSRVSIRLR
jgi:hypothetical protein